MRESSLQSGCSTKPNFQFSHRRCLRGSSSNSAPELGLSNCGTDPPMDDYEVEEKKHAAIRVLSNYSQFVMACIGEAVSPHQLRLHLMKEIAGMPTSLGAQKAPVAEKGEIASSSSDATSSMDPRPPEASSLSDRSAGAAVKN